MARHATQPPWDFLLSASRNSLQSFEFTRLAHAANLRKEISALLDQWQQETAAAMLARWLMEQREHHGKSVEPLFCAEPALAPEQNAPDGRNAPGTVSDNFFADSPVPAPQKRRPA